MFLRKESEGSLFSSHDSPARMTEVLEEMLLKEKNGIAWSVRL